METLIIQGIRRFNSSVRVRHSLPNIVGQLCGKIRDSQVTNSGTLLECIEGLIDKHSHDLLNHYGVKQGDLQQLWNQLLNQSYKNQLLADLPINFQTKYENFIKSLNSIEKSSNLPLKFKNPQIIDIISNMMKYYNVNHNQLFQAYLELPSPAPLHLNPQVFQTFLEKFLYHKHDFIKPNILSINYIKTNPAPRLLVDIFNDMLSKRQEYLRMVTHIIDDMKKSGYQLSIKDQNYLIFISFYKDIPEISDKILQTVNNLHYDVGLIKQYPKFDWEIYQQLKNSLPVGIDTYNVFLFHAIRHNCQQIIADILKQISLHKITDNSAQTKVLKPNSKTIRILLQYYSSSHFLKQSNSLVPFTECIEYILNSDILIDIKLMNLIINGLVSVDQIKLAESMLSAFQVQKEDDSELLMSKQLTPEDKFIYNKLFSVFEKIKAITSDETNFEIIPTENTFLPLISYYCNNRDIDKVKVIFNIMQKSYKLPITTRTYKLIFQSIIENPCKLEEVIQIVSEMLSMHDFTYNITQDNMIKNFKGTLTPSLRSFIDNHLITPESINLPKDRGNFIKLSDDLILMIYDTLIASAKAEQPQLNTSKLLGEIRDHKLNFQATLANARRNKKIYNNAASRSAIYQIDEVIYLKKGFLVDLIDLVDKYLTSENIH